MQAQANNTITVAVYSSRTIHPCLSNHESHLEDNTPAVLHAVNVRQIVLRSPPSTLSHTVGIHLGNEYKAAFVAVKVLHLQGDTVQVPKISTRLRMISLRLAEQDSSRLPTIFGHESTRQISEQSRHPAPSRPRFAVAAVLRSSS